MDLDSSAKFIGSLTKFLQSLCNGYVEFQNGVELVGHIYLNIDTGEKVDYILHEKVSKNDENSVSFVSNSFHALPACNLRAAVGSNIDRAEKGVLQTGTSIDSVNELKTAYSDDDLIIIDQPYSSVGCNNFVPAIPKVSKRKGSPYDELISARKFRDSVPPVTSDSPSCDALTGGCALLPCVERSRQENMDIIDMKLEQMSNDELLSLTSHVDASGGHQSQSAIASIPHQSVMASEDSHGNNDVSWIKKEPPDLDPGNKALWFNDGGDLDSSPGSRMYPVMMHQSAGSFSAPVFPYFADSNAACTMATNMFDNPMAGTSQDIDPSGMAQERMKHTVASSASSCDHIREIDYACTEHDPFTSPRSRPFLLPLEFRIELINRSTNMSQRQLAAMFGISKTQVFGILKNKDEIFNLYEMQNGCRIQQ